MASLNTGIAWTDATWSPTRGCQRVDGGCTSCYAEREANRHAGPGDPYEGLIHISPKGEPRWSGEGRVIEDHLDDPLRWKRPRMVFVDSMSDLFFDRFSDEQIARVCAVMALARQHRFQVLTKRHERLKAAAGEICRGGP